MTDISWLCPLCKGKLTPQALEYRCDSGHSYDRAKQGYVNLLLANQKKSMEPGDNAEMINARHEFLAQGHYEFLLQSLYECIAEVASQTERMNIVDIGCGEGYYLKGLHSKMEAKQLEGAQKSASTWQFWGIDISKPAVKHAARELKTGHFAVASCVDVPLPEGMFDIALNIFAPISASEIKRLLKPSAASSSGVLLRVSPGEQHLIQLKERLYRQASFHKAPKVLERSQLLSEIKATNTVTLSNAQIQQLLAMTPLNWSGDRNMKAHLQAIDMLEITFDFVIQTIGFENDKSLDEEKEGEQP